MNASIAERLDTLGIHLPTLPPPKHSYTTYVRAGGLLFFSGKTATVDGAVVTPGRLGDTLDLSEGRAAARLAATNMLAAIEQEIGLETVRSVVKLTGYVASAADFHQQPEVVNAASELFADVLGANGVHARTAVGVAALPGGTPVEIDVVLTELDTPA